MQYTSKLAPYITGLIIQKQALGYSFSYGVRILGLFDCFCAQRYPDEETITRAMGLEWAIQQPSEKAVSTAKRLAPIRELAKYMQRKGMDAYIIPNDFVKQPNVRYAPHIFTEDELARFFYATDTMNEKVNSRCLAPLVMPVLFRLIYSCGLRPQEGRLILRKNLDLKEGVLLIPESKRHTDRFVVLSEDMLTLCRKYDSVIRKLRPNNDFFFPSGLVTCYKSTSVEQNFTKCWNRAGLHETSRGNQPRIYDFRHTFATRCLYRWAQEGRDPNVCLPYLSAYMGHAHFSQTAYYIHLVPEFFPCICKMDRDHFSTLIPEAEDDEI